MEEMNQLSADNAGTSLTIDAVIKHVGEFKLFQWRVSALLCFAVIPVAFQVLIMSFAALNPTWKCVENSTQCNFTGYLSPENRSRCFLPRNEWEYSEPEDYSIVTSFDVHCDSEWLLQFSKSVIFLGGFCGSLISGWVGDRYGRRKIIFICTAVILFSTLLTAFASQLYLVLLLRFIIGFFLNGAYQSAVLLSEIVANRYRPLASVIIWCVFPFAFCLLGLKAYLVRSWRNLFLVCSVPYLFIPLFYFVIPESPRWLRLNGRKKELERLFSKMAMVNKRTLPADVSILPPSSEKERTNPLNLFRTCKLALITLLNGYAGFVNALVYYGLSLIAVDFGGSIYLDFVLISLSELPGTILAIISSAHFGRKVTTLVSFLGAFFSCLALTFLKSELLTLRITAAMLGKLFISCSWNSQGVWLLELYPTTLRAQGYSSNGVFTTIGSSCSPWMITGLYTLHKSGPFICMGVASFSCFLFLFLLKETKGQQTVECEADISSQNKALEEIPLLSEDEEVELNENN